MQVQMDFSELLDSWMEGATQVLLKVSSSKGIPTILLPPRMTCRVRAEGAQRPVSLEGAETAKDASGRLCISHAGPGILRVQHGDVVAAPVLTRSSSSEAALSSLPLGHIDPERSA